MEAASMVSRSLSVFGAFTTQESTSGTVFLIVILIMVLMIESLLEFAEHYSKKIDCEGLIKKLYHEFILLGIIEITLIILLDTSETIVNSEWFHAFELAHIIILFIGLSFVVQAGMFVFLITSRQRTMAHHNSLEGAQLLIDYIDMHKIDGLKSFFFDYGPGILNYPRLREEIEYKIIRDFFIRSYNLPLEFKFSSYISQSLRHYIIDFIEVKPIIWLCLCVLISLNFVKLQLIDPMIKDMAPRCGGDEKHYDDDHTRRLSGGEEGGDLPHANECISNQLFYAAACSGLLSIFILGILTASELYYTRLMTKILSNEERLSIAETLDNDEDETPEDVGKSKDSSVESTGFARSIMMGGSKVVTATGNSFRAFCGREFVRETEPTSSLSSPTPPITSLDPKFVCKFDSLSSLEITDSENLDPLTPMPKPKSERSLDELKTIESHGTVHRHGYVKYLLRIIRDHDRGIDLTCDIESSVKKPADRLRDHLQHLVQSKVEKSQRVREIGLQKSQSLTFVDLHAAERGEEEKQTIGSRLMGLAGNFCSLMHTAFNYLANGGNTLMLMMFRDHRKESHMDKEFQDMEDDLSEIFLFKSWDLYHYSIQLAILCQCLYISCWATNLSFAATDSYATVHFHIWLVFPIPFNFYMLKHILFTSSTLKAVIHIDKSISDGICEDAIEERGVVERLRRLFRSTLKDKLDLDVTLRMPYLKKQFDMFSTVEKNLAHAFPASVAHHGVFDAKQLTRATFRQLLHSLQIFLNETSMQRIFKVIDVDESGSISWQELSTIIFPELTTGKITGVEMKNSFELTGYVSKAALTSRISERKKSLFHTAEESLIGEHDNGDKGNNSDGNFGVEFHDSVEITYDTNIIPQDVMQG